MFEHREDGAYVLTRKGRELAPALHQLMKWGDRHYPRPEGPPRLTLHRGCGGRVEGDMVCARCGEHVASASSSSCRAGARPSTAAG